MRHVVLFPLFLTALALLLSAQPPPVTRQPASAGTPPPRADTPAAQPPTGPKAAPAQPPHIPFGPSLRLMIKPTLLGLVPPADPQHFGELFIYLRRLSGDGFTARYWVKELAEHAVPTSAPAAAPAVEPPAVAPEDPRRPRLALPRSKQPEQPSASQPPLKLKTEVRIRRGVITAAPAGATARIENPLFWGDGDWQVSSRLLWLSREAYTSLRTTSRCAWDPTPLEAPGGQGASPLSEALKQLLGAAAQPSAPPVELLLTGYGTSYPAYVNGQRTSLPCLTARDSLGLCNYWILDQDDNPLVLKASFADSADPAVLSAAPPEGSQAVQALPGSGFAVVSIDFSPGLLK